MPFYDFKCPKCDRVYQTRLSIKESEEPRYCEEDGRELVQLISPPMFNFVGNWFSNKKEY